MFLISCFINYVIHLTYNTIEIPSHTKPLHLLTSIPVSLTCCKFAHDILTRALPDRFNLCSYKLTLSKKFLKHVNPEKYRKLHEFRYS